MKARLIASAVLLLIGFGTAPGADIPSKAQLLSGANRLTYLDRTDPFYVGIGFPKLTTPQWIGEPGVDAAIILSIDDMTETRRYETFLRPLLERLKQIDGRAPVSIMTRSVPVDDPQVQTWLNEGLSLEVHTLNHPCPLLANGDFNAAVTNVYGCIDLLNRVPGNKPAAFRMPCCDSMDSTSPRFFAEIFNGVSPGGHFLTADSSVINVFTTADPELPAALVSSAGGSSRFAKYFQEATNATTRVSLGAFATTIENYPFPYVIGKLCWEFPCVAPSDWEAFNSHGATNAETVADWEAALDATVLKQGVFTLIFHPHGWIRSEQLVSLVDYAVAKYGKRVKFLTFSEAQQRLDKNLLVGEPLRAADGRDNGVRLLDVNNDGWLDVVIANERTRTTRIWDPTLQEWTTTEFPTEVVTGGGRETGVRFGTFGPGAKPAAFYRNEAGHGAWVFAEGEWREQPEFLTGLNLKGRRIMTSEGGRDRGVRLYDVNHDGSCELLVGNDSQNAVFGWNDGERSWKKLGFALPPGTGIVTADGRDNGLRFVDVNGDGYDDVLFSNQKEFSLHLFIAQAKPWLGWDVGWSYQVRAGKRGDIGEIPMLVRGGAHPDNGAWFHGPKLFVQNEDTSGLPDKVRWVGFDELQAGGEARPKTPAEALSSFRLVPGFKIELVVSEPQVLDPVAFDWTPDGRLWVVEMRDYPLGIDGKGKPGGVVRVLEDTKGDGHYDKSTVFLDGLRFPNGLMPWRNGLLVSAAPDIFYAEDADRDGKADVQKLLFTGFHEGNQQHRVNGFDYGLDNWVYAANGGSGGTVHSTAKKFELNLRGHDLRFNPDDGSMELQPGPTQFGRHRDDWGNWFGNDNSRWLWHYFLPEQYLARNSHLAVNSLMKLLPGDPDPERIFAISRPQQRFNWPTHVFEVTSACSATPYRDEVLGPDFASSVFICEPANNVVHREVLQPEGVSFVSHRGREEQSSEFLASTDNWFRPVMVKTGPDGALYLADMYRLIIEHPEYFPEELKRRSDLRAGEDKGRIYRVYPANAQLRKIPRLDRLSLPELVAAMDSPNGWQRDTVQRLLVEAQNPAVVKDLENLVTHSGNPKVRLQALCTLDGLHAVTAKLLLDALGDAHYAVRRQALALSESKFSIAPELNARLLEMAEDPDLRVRYQLAFSLGEWKGTAAGQALAHIAMKDWSDGAMQTAILSSAPRHLETLVTTVFSTALSRKAESHEAQNNSQSGPRGTRPSERWPADSLVESLVALATEIPENRVLAHALDQLTQPLTQDFAPWQFAGVVGFLDGLDKRKLSLAAFKQQAGAEFQPSLARLEPIFVQARIVALDPKIVDEQRVIALQLLGRGVDGQEQDIASLGGLIEPQNPAAIQHAALAQLRREDNPAVPQALFKSWKTSGPSRKQEILNLLFSRPAWTEAVLTAVEQDKLTAAELGALQRQKLLNYSVPDIQARAAKLLSSISADRQQIVAKFKIVPELAGDRSHGRALFAQNCAICHSLQGEGHHVGPDLGTVADKPVQELVVAILDPNQAVDPAYASYTAVTKDDRELTGVLIADTPNSISLRMAGGSEETILRNNLKELTSSGRSLMPEGFETGLKPQDIADLIAFISDTPPPSRP